MRIGFFGCGFLASWLVHPVLKFFTPTYILLVDMERFEEKNIENTLFVKTHIGMGKATALKMFIIQTENMPPQNIATVQRKIDERDFHKLYRESRLDLAIVTFDDPQLRNRVADVSLREKLDTLFVGVTNNLNCAAIWAEDWRTFSTPDMSREEVENMRVCERREMVMPAMLASFITIRAIKNFMEGRKISYIYDGEKIVSLASQRD